MQKNPALFIIIAIVLLVPISLAVPTGGNLTDARNQQVKRAKVQAATTTDELVTIRKEANAYIKSNKDVIKNAAKELQKALNDEMVAKAGNLTAKINETLEVLKNECPEQADEITKAQQDAANLISETQQLKQMVDEGKNQALISALAAKVSQMASALVPQVEAIAKACKKTGAAKQ